MAYEGGFVWPATKHLPEELVGVFDEVTTDGASQGEGAPGASGPRSQATGAGEAAAWPTAAGSGAPVVGSVVAGEYDLAEALRRYPQFEVSKSGSSASGAVGLCGVIQPIADLPTSASMAVHLPAGNPAELRAWAWWTEGVWVGPRHTYIDGSVCAFEIRENTWDPGLGVVLLLNLYSVWLAKQLYLRPTDAGRDSSEFTRPSSASRTGDCARKRRRAQGRVSSWCVRTGGEFGISPPCQVPSVTSDPLGADYVPFRALPSASLPFDIVSARYMCCLSATAAIGAAVYVGIASSSARTTR